jgi:hypothetical protein
VGVSVPCSLRVALQARVALQTRIVVKMVLVRDDGLKMVLWFVPCFASAFFNNKSLLAGIQRHNPSLHL